ncbi:conserved hypothetical protein [Neospora caninum Liverpool]|uniref:Ubiquitin interaction motif domain-containing protein n=1 Tax=Neospora caninum (strain Liverpool) TaxID=572307 RepID=F0VG39_NEOCL|nr:conserved hypothetical protein [Neospora caninum Liverpool]CBZ52683.1 conserved hypothetical protein [Neospora caninum Liverpool]CEL66660.1 TPA: ubiquitin interaction motif domain-containing protein [Neospora caninum Liverpool]|eukprot:XP_003882715.1 conserved hypothetical protein [Neospora caninum Liverpool]
MEEDRTSASCFRSGRGATHSGDELPSEEEWLAPGRPEARRPRRPRGCGHPAASEERHRGRERRRKRRRHGDSSESNDGEETRRRRRDRRRPETGRSTREGPVVISDEDEDEQLQLALALSASLQDGHGGTCGPAEKGGDTSIASATLGTEDEPEREATSRRSDRGEEGKLTSREALPVESSKARVARDATAPPLGCQHPCGAEAGERGDEERDASEETGWRRRRGDEARRREESELERQAGRQAKRRQASDGSPDAISRDAQEREQGEAGVVLPASHLGRGRPQSKTNRFVEQTSSLSGGSGTFEEDVEDGMKTGSDRKKHRRSGMADAREGRRRERPRTDGVEESGEVEDDENEDFQLALALSISEQHDVYNQCRVISDHASSPEKGPAGFGSSSSGHRRESVCGGAEFSSDLALSLSLSPSAASSSTPCSSQSALGSEAGISERSEQSAQNCRRARLPVPHPVPEHRDSKYQGEQRDVEARQYDETSSRPSPVSPPPQLRKRCLGDGGHDLPSNPVGRPQPEKEPDEDANAAGEKAKTGEETKTEKTAATAEVEWMGDTGARGMSGIEYDLVDADQREQGIVDDREGTPTRGRFIALSMAGVDDGVDEDSSLSPASDAADSDFEPDRRRPRRRAKVKGTERLPEDEGAASSESSSDSPCSSLVEEGTGPTSPSSSDTSEADAAQPQGGRRNARKRGNARRAVPSKSSNPRNDRSVTKSKTPQRPQPHDALAERVKGAAGRPDAGNERDGVRERQAKKNERKALKEQQRAVAREAASTAVRLWKREKLQEACVYIWQVLTHAVASPVPLSSLRAQGNESDGNRRGVARASARPGGGKLANLLRHAQLEEEEKIMPSPACSLSTRRSGPSGQATSEQGEERTRGKAERPQALELHKRSRAAGQLVASGAAGVRPFVTVGDLAQVAQTVNLSLQPDEIQQMISLAAREGSPVLTAEAKCRLYGSEGGRARDADSRAREKEKRALALYTEGKTYLSFEEFERFFHTSLGLKVEKNGKVW